MVIKAGRPKQDTPRLPHVKCCSLFFHLFFLRLLHFHMCMYSCGYLYPFVKKRQSDESMMTRMSDDV